MKNWLKISLRIFLIFCLILTPFSFINIGSIKAQLSSITIYDGLDPQFYCCIVNSTYARGDSWSLRFENGVFKWSSEPAWVWNGTRYVPYIFTRDDAKKCWRIQTGLVAAEIYDKGDVKIYDPNVTEVRIKSEWWEIWADGKEATLSGGITWSTIVNDSGVFVERIQETDKPKGVLKIAYVFRVGQALKHIVEWTANEDVSNVEVRQIHLLDFDKVKTSEGEVNSSAQLKSAYYLFEYGGEFWVEESQWSMMYYPNGSLRENECFQSASIDFSGKQVIYSFGYWSLTAGESLRIDPDTATFTAIDDAFVKGYSKDYATAHSSGVTYYPIDSYAKVGQSCYSGFYEIHRAFIKIDTTSLPSSAEISYAKLRLKGYSDCSIAFTIRLQKWTGDSPINRDDYTQYDGVNYDDGAMTSAAWTEDVWNDIVITNYNLITKAGYTKICVRSSKDISQTPPAADTGEWISFYTVDSGSAPQLYVEYTVPNLPPTNDACVASATFDVNVYGWVNVTASDADGVADLNYVQIKVTTSDSKYFTLKWDQASNSFSEVADPDGICTLDAAGSTRVNVDADTDKICFHFKISVAAQKGYCSVEVTSEDDFGAQDIDTYTNLFSINFYIEIIVIDTTHGWSEVMPGDTDVLLTAPSDGDIDLTVSANWNFAIQVKGSGDLSDGNGHTIPLGNIKVHKNTLASAVSLTTTYTTVGGLENQARGVNLDVSFKLWITIPDNLHSGTYTYTLYVRGIEAS